MVTVDKDGAGTTLEFDAVMVCSGHHWAPRWPTFPGMDRFKGVQMHSHSYKDPAPVAGKRVVVVGVGNSGGMRLRAWRRRGRAGAP